MPLPGLLARITADPGRPRLTWYGDDAERVELSGHVLDNWVTKTANLLVEEYQAGPLTRVLVDLPVHWRAVVWAMATWRVGACVTVPPAGRPDRVVPPEPPRPPAAGTDVVAVALPALARHLEGELPANAVDATGSVMTYGDVLTYMPEPSPSAPAIKVGEDLVAHAALEQWAADALHRRGVDSPGGRVLLQLPADALAEALALTLAVLAGNGSVVLCAPGVDAAARERIAAAELVVSRVVAA
jgi:uncharacterized protein (TIGR03089 family)